ncbi:MAG: GNAT family N-acetyltransferase [Gemmatimonadota bacterium]
MHEPRITIRRVTPGEAAILADLAARTFRDAFGAANRAVDLELHIRTHYGAARQAAELADPRMTALFVEADGMIAGYTQVRDGPAPACVSGPRPIELWRFYVDHVWHGRGIAAPLMDAVKAEARRRGGRTLWLGVWERNPRAIAFYRKQGFSPVGSQVYVVGTDPQNDLVMSCSLDPR